MKLLLVPPQCKFSLQQLLAAHRVPGGKKINLINSLYLDSSRRCLPPAVQQKTNSSHFSAAVAATVAKTLIVGLSAGIGRATALRLAAEGAIPVIADLNLDALTAADLQALARRYLAPDQAVVALVLPEGAPAPAR